ncbi:hypothetical protein LTR56_006211 [Elasticomyces elasticus]|nr:hypothetical protein LTR56_006211 [Elasticomyces elasticus]KAK3666580.1 hypothetical protein LTR22_002524 [Elasticomyces elasticus]KAK4928287.1 hypothetical protein LTR49_004964 [Elasticomyces elasticus]KAK5763850.1 hypothetical protein LTS12_005968 [Elasticomyces elasticus]
MPTLSGLRATFVHGGNKPYEEHPVPSASIGAINSSTSRAILLRRLPAASTETAYLYIHTTKNFRWHRATALHIQVLLGKPSGFIVYDEILLKGELDEKVGVKLGCVKALPDAVGDGMELVDGDGEWTPGWDTEAGTLDVVVRRGMAAGKFKQSHRYKRGGLPMGAKKGLEGKVEWKVLGGEQGKEIAVGFVIRGRDYDLDAAAARFEAKAAAKAAERLKQSAAPPGPAGEAARSASGDVATGAQDGREVEGQTQNAVALQPSGNVIARAQSTTGAVPIEKLEPERARQSASTPAAHGTRNWKYWKKHNASAAQSVVSMPTRRASHDGANTIHSVTIKHEPRTDGMDLDTAENLDRDSAPSEAAEELKPRTQLVRSTAHDALALALSASPADDEAEWETASSSEEDNIIVKPTALTLFGSGLLATRRETSVLPEQVSEMSFPKLSPGFVGDYDGEAAFARPPAGLTGDNLAGVGNLATEVPAPTIFAEYAETPQVQQHVVDGVRPTPTMPADLPELAVQIHAAATTLSENPVKAADLKSEVEDFTFTDDSNKLKRKVTNMDQDDEEEEALKYEMAEIALKKREMEVEKRLRELAKRRRMAGGK